MGFPAKTVDGKIVDIVSKTDGDPSGAILTDSDGNEYTANGQLLYPVDAPAAGSEPAPEPEAESVSDDAPASTDDDPLGNPLAGWGAATAEGVASGDPVPDDAAPTESDEDDEDF